MNWRRVGAALCAMAVAVTVFAASHAAAASGTDIVWKTKQIPWAFKAAGTNFSGSAKDTAYITDEADSIRTDVVNTGDWAWDAFTIGPGAFTVNASAYLTLTVNQNNGTADSVYFMIEQGKGGTLGANGPLPAAAALGNYLGKVGVGTFAGSRICFQGPILTDVDDVPVTSNRLYVSQDFRLVLRGDQSGTTPKMSQCRLWITYPSRRASQ
jgi:hypothetical protein